MDQSGPIMADCDSNSLMLSHPSDLSPTVRIDAQNLGPVTRRNGRRAPCGGRAGFALGESHADAVQSGGANGYAPRGTRIIRNKAPNRKSCKAKFV